MAGIKKLYKANKLGPLGILASITCFVGVIIPWKITSHGPINGMLEPAGWFILVTLILYLLLLFVNFKWNIFLAFGVLAMSIYELWHLQLEIDQTEDAHLGIGIPMVITSSVIMMISKILLFRKGNKKA